MRGSAARAFLPAVAVLALAAVVAVAARGSTPGGTSDRRGPSELVLDTLVTVTLLMMAFSLAMIVFALFHRKELGNVLPPHHRRSSVSSVVVFLAVLGLLALLHSRGLLPGSDGGEQTNAEGMPPGSPETGADNPYEPELAWIPVIVLAALALIAYAAATYAARRRRGPQPRSEAAALLAEAFDDSLADLLAEEDPRRAVIATYARLERVLGAHRLGRRSSETPEEYLARILPELEVDPASIRRLTDLFTWAKFSPHEVRPDMKEEAIEALRTARDDLRAAARGEEPVAPVRPVAGRPA
jgi:membrane protease YdiL (CAAX protease family)